MADVMRRTARSGSIVLLVSATFGGGALLLAGAGNEARVIGSTRTHTGQAQLVSFEPFEDEVCLMPGAVGAGAEYSTYPVTSSQSSADRQQERRPIHVDRAPARFIKDPWPAWSAVAVNPEHDMVILTDENLHRIVEYHRLDNTRPDQEMTEPRRVIAGLNTQTEMLCGAYVDPRTLDVYVTNNDTVNWMPVFSREARGDVAPDRVLATPHRAWGIAADELRQELYMTIQSPSAVVVYRKAAAGAEAPLRILEGDATELADARGIAVDVVNDVLVVPNPFSNAILTFRGGANGQEAPIRVIQGPNTRLTGPDRFGLDVANREILVAGDGGTLVFPLGANGDVTPVRVIPGGPRGTIEVDPIHNLLVATDGDEIRVFKRSATGEVTLRNVIKGPNTGISTPRLAIYPEGNLIAVGMRGPEGMEPPGVFIGIWNLDDEGDVPPRWKIDHTVKKPFAVTLNREHKEIIVTDMRLNGVLTFYFPEMFESGASAESEASSRK